MRGDFPWPSYLYIWVYEWLRLRMSFAKQILPKWKIFMRMFYFVEICFANHILNLSHSYNYEKMEFHTTVDNSQE